MHELLNKAKINDAKLKSLMSRTVSSNLSSLAEPCYYPDLKKDYYEFLKAVGLTEKDVKEFSKNRWMGRKEANFSTNTNPLANFYVFLLEYALKKNDKQLYTYTMIFYIIRHYANLMHKHFKFCNKDAFKYTLEVLTKTHLFARERTISNALYYMAQEMMRRWTNNIKKGDLDAIGAFMRESRHRVSQSIKSFAQTYYRVSEEGGGIKTEELPSENEENDNMFGQSSVSKIDALADSITQKITVYRYKNLKIQEEMRKKTKINASIATQIISKLNNPKYSDNIRLTMKLFLRDITATSQICGKDYDKYVRQLMSLKRTKLKIYFKQQINVLLMELLNDFSYKEKYEKLTNQTQFLINLFLAYYLTGLIQENICPKH